MVSSTVRRLSRCRHHQHDVIVEERTGVLRYHSPISTRPHVSTVSITSLPAEEQTVDMLVGSVIIHAGRTHDVIVALI